MSVIVQKYGGTSVGSIERIRAVAERVCRAKQAGNDVVVVVSAMAGETDRLLGLARDISTLPDTRELDMLLATGEMVSIALLAIALNEAGCEAASFTGTQGGIVTDEVHSRARIKQITPTRLQQTLDDGVVPVVAGFQGGSETQDFTTLGRGGARTSLRSRSRRPCGRICARSIRMSMESIAPIRELSPTPGNWCGSLMMKCWNWPV